MDPTGPETNKVTEKSQFSEQWERTWEKFNPKNKVFESNIHKNFFVRQWFRPLQSEVWRCKVIQCTFKWFASWNDSRQIKPFLWNATRSQCSFILGRYAICVVILKHKIQSVTTNYCDSPIDHNHGISSEVLNRYLGNLSSHKEPKFNQTMLHFD